MRQGQLLVIEPASVPQAALMQRARDVAAALGLEVFVCCIRDESDLPPVLPARRERVQNVRAKLMARSRRALDRRLEAMKADGIKAGGSVKYVDSVRKAVLELVRENSPACVMIARMPHSSLEEATLAGEDFAIVRESPVPVWVVNRSHGPGDKIIGAVGRPRSRRGGATLDDRILDEVAELAEKLGKEGHAVHAFGEAGMASQPLEPPAGDPADDMGTSRNDERIERVLEFVQAHGIAPERAHIYEGRLERVLEEESQPMNADLIVVGAGADGFLKRLFSGSTTEDIIQHVETDVLVLKQDEARPSA